MTSYPVDGNDPMTFSWLKIRLYNEKKITFLWFFELHLKLASDSEKWVNVLESAKKNIKDKYFQIDLSVLSLKVNYPKKI